MNDTCPPSLVEDTEKMEEDSMPIPPPAFHSGSIDPQIIFDKKNGLIKKKLQEYVKSNIEDPAYELNTLSNESKDEKLREAAQIIKYYWSNGMLNDNMQLAVESSQPEVRDEMELSPDVCWKKMKRYRLCVHGNRQVLQAGDYVLLENKRKGRIAYFTKEKVEQHEIVHVHLNMIYMKHDFSSVWQSFIKTKEELVCTDVLSTIMLGQIIEILNRDAILFSPFILENNCLRERVKSTPDMVTLGKLLVESYLTADSKMLHYHPLVKIATNFVSLLCKPTYISHLIMSDFMPYSMGMLNDMEDEKQYDFADFTMLNRISLREDVCTLCTMFNKLVFDGDTGSTSCESCYVRLRKIYYRIFSKLEPWRRISQSKKLIQENEDMEEVHAAVGRLLQSCS